MPHYAYDPFSMREDTLHAIKQHSGWNPCAGPLTSNRSTNRAMNGFYVVTRTTTALSIGQKHWNEAFAGSAYAAFGWNAPLESTSEL
jgi:hypothetical protein